LATLVLISKTFGSCLTLSVLRRAVDALKYRIISARRIPSVVEEPSSVVDARGQLRTLTLTFTVRCVVCAFTAVETKRQNDFRSLELYKKGTGPPTRARLLAYFYHLRAWSCAECSFHHRATFLSSSNLRLRSTVLAELRASPVRRWTRGLDSSNGGSEERNPPTYWCLGLVDEWLKSKSYGVEHFAGRAGGWWSSSYADNRPGSAEDDDTWSEDDDSSRSDEDSEEDEEEDYDLS